MSDSLSKHLRHNFKFEPDVRDKLLAILTPCEAWMEQYRNTLAELIDNYEVAIIDVMQSCANRFLYKSSERAWPATKGAQKVYLEQLEEHTGALVQLLALNTQMDGTTADPFRFLEYAFKDKDEDTAKLYTRTSTLKLLAALQYFAKVRLQTNITPLAHEEIEEKTKRKGTYPRIVLFADLLAAYVRITDKRPTATARIDDKGQRKVSEAVDFISIAAPPILKAARIDKIGSYTDDQTIKNDIAEINNLWSMNKRPEFSYAIPSWGKHFS